MAERINIPLADNFLENEWANYVSFDPITQARFATQRHIDIRGFQPSEAAWKSVGFVSTGNILGAKFRGLPGLEMKIKGEKSFESKLPERPINLVTGFTERDLVTFALHNNEDITLSESFIDLTSNAEADFTKASETASVAFSASEIPITSGAESLNQFVIERGKFTAAKFNPERVTGVRFRIKNGAVEKTIRIFGLRLIQAAGGKPEEEPGWALSSVDFDNFAGMLRRPTPLNADITTPVAFTQSPIWRSAPLAGANDPTPVDANIQVIFNTGSETTLQNSFTIYLRQESKIFQTQLDLQGTTMAELDGRPQPDLGTKKFVSRTMEELDLGNMEEFDRNQTMETLERKPVPSPLEESWCEFTVSWGAKNQVIMTNNSVTGYVLALPALITGKEYLCDLRLEGSTARLRLYTLEEDLIPELEPSGIAVPAFDSTLLIDDGTFRRRNGRFGWLAKLEDFSAYIRSIRPNGVNYAEYLSAPLVSRTPVGGAQLFAEQTPPTQLWTSFEQFPAGASGEQDAFISRDTARTTSGESWKITTKGNKTKQGFLSNPFVITDQQEFKVEFNIWYVGSARFPESKPLEAEPSIGVTLFNGLITGAKIEERGEVKLAMPELRTNQWQNIKLSIPAEQVFVAGTYQLLIAEEPAFATNWWIDSVFISERAMSWAARSVIDDPWSSNYAPWTPFGDTVNQEKDGIVLQPRGTDLQLRGRARRQDVVTKQPKLVPQYAQLGRLVWAESTEKESHTPPSATFTVKSEGGHVYKLTNAVEGIVSRTWDFGDGERATGNLEVIEHTWAKSGTYEITLTVANRYGQIASSSQELVIP